MTFLCAFNIPFTLLHICSSLGLKTCKEHEFRCNAGQCIPLRYVCNANQDCRDGSDEDTERCRKYLLCNKINVMKVKERKWRNFLENDSIN